MTMQFNITFLINQDAITHKILQVTKYTTRFHFQIFKIIPTERTSEFYMDITRSGNHFPSQY
jgi:hypothetical protein